MTATTKHFHIAAFVQGGHFAGIALCGRRVNRLSMTDEGGATCPKCMAKANLQVAG